VTFVAQAPGELRVSDARFAYDMGEPAAPPMPDSLCTPTHADDKPGVRTEHCSHCPSCGDEHPFEDEGTPVRTPAGRPAIEVRCCNCGSRSIHLGGRLVRDAAVAYRLAATRVAVSMRPSTETVRRALSLTAIDGIGEERARRFEAIGIATLRQLSLADPAVVAARLSGVSEAMARTFVADARRRTLESVPAAPHPVPSPAAQPTEQPLPALRDVHGVGAVRARLLADAGVESVAQLAALSPAELEQRVRSLPAGVAAELVDDAKRLLAERGSAGRPS
jgi:predicted flap endonuclease-1-like 5' DNA nuclease